MPFIQCSTPCKGHSLRVRPLYRGDTVLTDAAKKPQYIVGRPDVEGDRRRYYVNKQLALNYANDAAKYWPDKVRSVDSQFEPNFGFVPILHTTGALPEAQEHGFEIKDALVPFVPTKTPDNWHGKRAASGGGSVATTAAKRTDGSQRPSRGKTLRAWEIFDTMPTAPRKECIAVGVAEGLNPNMLGTQYSRWAKEQKQS